MSAIFLASLPGIATPGPLDINNIPPIWLINVTSLAFIERNLFPVSFDFDGCVTVKIMENRTSFPYSFTMLLGRIMSLVATRYTVVL